MPSLGLSLGLSSAGSSFRDSGAVQQISGFPLRIRAFNGVSSINLYRTSQNAGSVEYFSDDAQTYVYWNFTDNYGEFYLNNFSVLISAPTLASVPTSWPSTGWGDGWQFGVANSTLVTLSYTSPQSFEYSNSVPSIVFTSSPVINANLFTISGLSSSNLGSQNAVISMERADYYLSNSVTIPVTITKKNVTLSINNQSSTYSPNATYNWFSAVGISTLAAGDTIQGRFNSDLLTGVPATNANAGSYTISFNPNYTSANYNITNSPASATWTINKASQTITFNPSGTALTTDSTNLSASSTSGLAVSFSVVSGPGSINGSTLTYSGAGSVVVRASQAGNGNYDPATNVDRTITVSAPQASGIPVASTNQIRLTTTNSYYNSYAGNGYGVPPHEKKTNSVQGNDLVLTQGLGYFSPGYGNSYGNIVLAPNSILFSNWDGAVLVNAQNTWTFWQVKFSYGEESSGYLGDSFLVATNPSTDANNIPTSGWTAVSFINITTITAA